MKDEEIKLIWPESTVGQRREILRNIWLKTYYAAITGRSARWPEQGAIVRDAKEIADKTIEMISPGTKITF